MEGLQQGQARLERRFERFEHRFDALEVRLRAGDANALARSLNSTVKEAGQMLKPLRSLRTGEVIEGFPETLAEINRMNSQPLNAILEELDQRLGGTLMERKRQLKLLCGVVTQLV
ncbi:hypothetical protein VD0002_g5964 [Verticillium dahliae]|nr:hypothetical protein BJF96_g1750 [Verticillium dahliae]PNH37674.1 hypothetical protein VD0004_g9119 [Verticillium dahliae]PNH49231.1 hypothetical protein VD0003_g7912 [Verticillium dahliae]PNH61957.1 hypothetical protein VD0002_g5964 [Verticillium dahliae]PNH66451.1 hypothetical protein VD0001_g8149 [Verticillium dahliae]